MRRSHSNQEDMDLSDDNMSFDSDTNMQTFDEGDFASRMNKDFDTRKTYEDTILKVLNEYSLQKVYNPENHTSFQEVYAKPETLQHLKNTLFLDLDDTLVKVSAY